jgi:hypothetical protein
LYLRRNAGSIHQFKKESISFKLAEQFTNSTLVPAFALDRFGQDLVVIGSLFISFSHELEVTLPLIPSDKDYRFIGLILLDLL